MSTLRHSAKAGPERTNVGFFAECHSVDNLFVKHHKDKMREFARQHGICNPIDVGLNKWGLKRRMTLEEERARNEAREETRVHM